jgi:hypothetical protein
MNCHLPLIIVLASTMAASGNPADQPDATPSDHRPQINLTPSMSDEQILRAMGLDPKALQARRDQGKDGYTMAYTSARDHLLITRSKVSGVIVMRLKPEKEKGEWTLGKVPDAGR